MQYVCAVCASCVLSFLLVGCGSEVTKSHAVSVRAKPEQVHLGTVKSGDRVDFGITLDNPNNFEVPITAVVPSCACVSLTKRKPLPKSIPPKSKVELGLVAMPELGNNGSLVQIVVNDVALRVPVEWYISNGLIFEEDRTVFVEIPLGQKVHHDVPFEVEEPIDIEELTLETAPSDQLTASIDVGRRVLELGVNPTQVGRTQGVIRFLRNEECVAEKLVAWEAVDPNVEQRVFFTGRPKKIGDKLEIFLVGLCSKESAERCEFQLDGKVGTVKAIIERSARSVRVLVEFDEKPGGHELTIRKNGKILEQFSVEIP